MGEQLERTQKLLRVLSRDEKSQVLRWLLSELGEFSPGIDAQSDVCGGEPCIVRTRIPVWLLERAKRLGTSDQQLLAAYPTLRLEDLENAWAYVRQHGAEIERQIAENEAA